MTTHLDTARLGIRCEGLACGDPLVAAITRALSDPLRVGAEVVEVRAQLDDSGVPELVGYAS